jgi:hypothetical protein
MTPRKKGKRENFEIVATARTTGQRRRPAPAAQTRRSVPICESFVLNLVPRTPERSARSLHAVACAAVAVK